MESRDAYVKKMQAKLDEWNADIAKLEAKAQGAKADAQAGYNQQIENLKSKREEAAGKLKEMQSAGDDAWEDLKAGIEMAWDSLGSAVTSAFSRFK